MQEPQEKKPQLPGYEILECLGRGSMGAVYRAREIKLNRFVALKFIVIGPHPKPADVLRFQIEAESLASVQHAGVVQVYEVGACGDQLFLAMELVPGASLQAFLEEQTITVREAANLALAMSSAVGALHLQGIVHRDLKPANVMLSADNEPKIADFGLAKRMETDSQVTREGMVVGTPCYMAPEQAEGKSNGVGPAADVFSLGVILYELLAHRKPFVGATVLSTLELIRFEEAVPPSRYVKHLPRDLETICLKCLQKNPAARYATAHELAADLQRYLRGEPVIARPVGPWHRTWKWCRRHPARAVSAMLVACGITSGFLAGAWHHHAMRAERDQTRAYFDLSQEAVEVLLTEVAEEHEAATPHSAEKRRAILETALDYYGQLESQASPASGLTSIAKLRKADCLRWLQRFEEAGQGYQHAITLLGDPTARHISHEQDTHQLAAAHNGSGQVHFHTQQYEQAISSYRAAIELNQQLIEAYPLNVTYLADLARNHNNSAACWQVSGSASRAREHLTSAIELLERLAVTNQVQSSHLHELAQSHLALGTVLQQLEEHEKVEAAYTRALSLYEQLHEDHPQNAKYHAQLAQAAQQLGDHHLAQGDLDSAEQYYSQAHEKLTELSAKHEAATSYREDLAEAQQKLAQVQHQQE